jgi:protein-disulfide isomerase
MNQPHRVATLAVPVSATDHLAGPAHARTVVLEYGDFECPTCSAAEPSVKQLRSLHPEMAFVFRHFPLEDAHPHALMAAEAAEAAGAQGKFWEMHDLLFAQPHHLSRPHLDAYAAQIGLDAIRFKAELDDEIYRQRVREHQQGGQRSHLRATPTFFVNGVVQDVSGGMQALFDIVAQELRRAAGA